MVRAPTQEASGRSRTGRGSGLSAERTSGGGLGEPGGSPALLATPAKGACLPLTLRRRDCGRVESNRRRSGLSAQRISGGVWGRPRQRPVRAADQRKDSTEPGGSPSSDRAPILDRCARIQGGRPGSNRHLRAHNPGCCRYTTATMRQRQLARTPKRLRRKGSRVESARGGRYRRLSGYRSRSIRRALPRDRRARVAQSPAWRPPRRSRRRLRRARSHPHAA
jgi:hypothetical protein